MSKAECDRVWQKLVEEAAKKGATVPIDLTGCEVKRPKGTRGRPPVVRATRWGNYAGYNPRNPSRPRCAQPGCGRWLRKDQKVACSPEHEGEVIAAHDELNERLKG